MPGRLKMEEIAALTGYSVSTVSRVLSGKSYTSDKAREAIVRTARELGVLESMASGRLLINGIAVFAPERTFQGRGDIFYLEVTKGITEACAWHNVWVSCCGLEEQHADVKLFMEKASQKNINAIIIIGTDDSTIFKLASTLNKPCVLINSVDRDRDKTNAATYTFVQPPLTFRRDIWPKSTCTCCPMGNSGTAS